MKHEANNIARQLAEHFGAQTDFKNRGEGFNGKGFEVRIGDKSFFLKTVNDSGFGNELPNRRLSRLIEAAQTFPHAIPIHAVFAVGQDSRLIGTIHEMQEAFALYELLPEGSSNFLELIRNPKTQLETIHQKALQMVDALADIHAEKYSGNNARALYDHSTRAIIHDEELIPGVWDFLKTNNPKLIKPEQFAQFLGTMSVVRDVGGTHPRRLTRVHGDYWAANVFFTPNDDVLITDSRIVWGEPAIDLAWMIGEFCMQDLIRSGQFGGNFSHLAQMMVERYQQKTRDRSIATFMALPYAFQAFAEATFTPNLSQEQRKTLIGAGMGGLLNALQGHPFSLDSLNQYQNTGRGSLNL